MPWCQQERALTLGWEQDDHTTVLPFPTLEENKKQTETTPYSTVSEGGTKPREINMPLLAQEPGSSQCCLPPQPSAIGCVGAELVGPSLTRGVKVLSPRAVKLSLRLLSQQGTSGKTQPRTNHCSYPTGRHLPSQDSIAMLSKGASTP